MSTKGVSPSVTYARSTSKVARLKKNTPTRKKSGKKNRRESIKKKMVDLFTLHPNIYPSEAIKIIGLQEQFSREMLGFQKTIQTGGASDLKPPSTRESNHTQTSTKIDNSVNEVVNIIHQIFEIAIKFPGLIESVVMSHQNDFQEPEQPPNDNFMDKEASGDRNSYLSISNKNVQISSSRKLGIITKKKPVTR